MPDPLSLEQLHILQHALGLDQYGRGRVHRNHFCAGHDDEPICRELVEMGYMVQHATTEWLPYFNCSVTEAGKAAMLRESPQAPKLTRSQQRYRQFLAADCEVSFFEWLKRAKKGTPHAAL
jgi:hypothetical protein